MHKPDSNDSKELCKEAIIEMIEMIDDKIAGPLMDLPVVDAIERKIVDVVVDSIWAISYHSHDIDDILPWCA